MTAPLPDAPPVASAGAEATPPVVVLWRQRFDFRARALERDLAATGVPTVRRFCAQKGEPPCLT